LNLRPQLVENKAMFEEEVLAEVRARISHAQRPLQKIIEDATANRCGHLCHAACGANGTLWLRRGVP